MKNAGTTEVKASALEQRRHCSVPDLFPETIPVTPLPIFPDPGSVDELALLAVIAGPTWLSEFRHSWRLPAYVGLLKDDDWHITSRDVSENGRTVSEYLPDPHDEPTSPAAAKCRWHAFFVDVGLVGLAGLVGLLVLGMVACTMLQGGV